MSIENKITKKEGLNQPNTLPIFLWLIPILMLLLAILPLPYGYYILLRVVISFVSGIIVFNEYIIKKYINSWVIVFCFFVLIYNPLIPFHLGKAIWTPINVITILCLILNYMSYLKRLQNNDGNCSKGMV